MSRTDKSARPPQRRVLTRFLALALLAAVVLPSTGCLRRRLFVQSNPAGAMVFVDNQQIGTTPCSVDFTYYGTREIRLVKPGFETLTVNQPIPTPWYQIPPIDFVSEILVPTNIYDHRTVAFNLQPQIIVPTDQLIDRANQLRQETLQQSAVVPAAAAVAVPVGPPAPVVLPPISQTAPSPTYAPGAAPAPFAAPTIPAAPLPAAPQQGPPIVSPGLH